MTELEYTKRINWSTEMKIDHALAIIEKFYNETKGKIHVSFSGGKDSTVLLYLVRKLYPNTTAFFVNTGLEYPEIVDFVKTIENVEIRKPRLSFKKVIEKYGYPVISKEQSRFINDYRTTKSEKMRKIRTVGGRYSISNKWFYLTRAPFKISDKCCYVLKKQPAHDFDKENGTFPILGIMATESKMRKTQYIKNDCEIFKQKNIKALPLSIFTDKDIWYILKKWKIPYCKIYDLGITRTGCMFCMYGVHLEEEPNRFQRMRITHPKQYKYCMEKLRLKEVLDFINIKYDNPHPTFFN